MPQELVEWKNEEKNCTDSNENIQEIEEQF